MSFKIFCNSLTRKKSMVLGETRLRKFLSAFDLTILGIGSTLGIGAYVISGEISKNVAGPAIILSFAISGFASLLAGFCYAEFGARVPKAGSAYIYCFVTIGEFIAFIIGWNLILEYSIGCASVAKGISNYIDAITGKRISKFFIDIAPLDSSFLGPYVDFLAFGIILIVTIGLAIGARESTLVSNTFTIVNVSVVVFVICCGCLNINFNNWEIPPEHVPDGYGNGGFLPYGLSGVIKGAGMCFYAFIGFDVIATAGEEAKDPKFSIPLSICVSLFTIFSAYFGISAVLTLMIPYYEQDISAPLPAAFNALGWTVTQHIVTYGAMFGMFSCLFGAMFPLPRIIYAIAEDGLIFRVFSKVHSRFKTPLFGTLIAGLFTSLVAMIFDLSQLVSMLSIGTIMAYSIVAASVLILRYEDDNLHEEEDMISSIKGTILSKVFNTIALAKPTKFSSRIIKYLVLIYVLFCAWMSVVISQLNKQILAYDLISMVLLIIPIIGIVLVLVIINRQPKSLKELSFKAPFNPWFPALSIMINIHLIVALDKATWIRFFIWVGIGLVIYFIYGRKNRERLLENDANSNLNYVDK